MAREARSISAHGLLDPAPSGDINQAAVAAKSRSVRPDEIAVSTAGDPARNKIKHGITSWFENLEWTFGAFVSIS